MTDDLLLLSDVLEWIDSRPGTLVEPDHSFLAIAAGYFNDLD